MESLFLPQEAWEAVGHAMHPRERVVAALGVAAPWAFFAFVLVVLFLAYRRRKRYRAVGVLDLAEVEQLRQAVRAAESQTVGEIGVVVLERSDEHAAAAWLSGVVLAAAGSLALLLSHPETHAALLLAFQGFLLAIGVWLASRIPDLRRRCLSEARASEMAEEQAIQEFHALDLRATETRTGILLFVSLFERRVVVLADQGIAQAVDPAIWEEVDRAVLAGAKRGELRAGLQAGIELVGRLLAERFPSTGSDANEVPDHVVVRRQ